MKKNYISLFVAVLMLTACDSFLEESPRSSITPEQAYATEGDLLNNAVLAVYNNIGGHEDSRGLQGTGRGVFDLNSLTTDEAIMPTRGGDWYDGGYWQTLFTHSWNAGTANLKDTWEYLFQSIIQCDEGIGHVVDYYNEKGIPMTAAGREYDAELRALRALFYFYAMDLFGNIPITSTIGAEGWLFDKSGILTEGAGLALSSSGETLKQQSRNAIYAFVLNELLDVLPELPDARSNQPGDYYGRMTQAVAYFLLAKLALNAKVYSDIDWTDGSRDSGSDIVFHMNGQRLNAWEFCAACCDSITTRGYQLESDFAHNFAPNNEDSGENIFTIPMNPTLYSNWYTYFFRSRHYSHGAVLGGASENGACATIELLDAFSYKGTADPLRDNSVPVDPDPRFALTFYADTVREGGSIVYEDDGVTPLVYHPREVRLDLSGSTYEKTAGARLRKYANDPNANADGRACNNDIVLFRYADVLLMKAEALVRNGQNGDAELNEVRRRVGLPAVAATLESILHERFVELAWEGWRRNDMVRFGLYHQDYTDRPTLSGESDGHTTVFPIPADIMTMQPSWTQNPGY